MEIWADAEILVINYGKDVLASFGFLISKLRNF